MKRRLGTRYCPVARSRGWPSRKSSSIGPTLSCSMKRHRRSIPPARTNSWNSSRPNSVRPPSSASRTGRSWKRFTAARSPFERRSEGAQFVTDIDLLHKPSHARLIKRWLHPRHRAVPKAARHKTDPKRGEKRDETAGRSSDDHSHVRRRPTPIEVLAQRASGKVRPPISPPTVGKQSRRDQNLNVSGLRIILTTFFVEGSTRKT